WMPCTATSRSNWGSSTASTACRAPTIRGTSPTSTGRFAATGSGSFRGMGEGVTHDGQGFDRPGLIPSFTAVSAGGERTPPCRCGLALPAWRPHRRPLLAPCAPAGTFLRSTGVAVILASMSEVTHILCAIEQGDPSSAEQLLPLVYDELRKL